MHSSARGSPSATDLPRLTVGWLAESGAYLQPKFQRQHRFRELQQPRKSWRRKLLQKPEILAAHEAAAPRWEELDASGRTAAHTGSGCWNAASHQEEAGVCAQANTVASPAIAEAMVAAYQTAAGPFATRLLAALDAAEARGGDLRGRQSAAVYIVGGEPVADVEDEALLDLRVDNDPEPLAKLRTAVGLALAFAPMWRVIRGPACRGSVAPTPEETDAAIVVLDAAQREYGPQNREPT